ncbi:MAG TPA: hypothetical protein VFH94_15885 [Streptomyces sp.]|nr:hypothetical protein [Streptomyces sp.]
MAGFATNRLRAHDRSRSSTQRFNALRTCIGEFAPYGFHATYHHLCRSAAIPAEPEVDSEAVVRAVDELHAAREICLSELRDWQIRRSAQKAAGVRVPDPPEPRRRLWCPDPEFHPTESLEAVMPRILKAPAGDLAVCPICPAGVDVKPWHDGHTEHLLCAGCGVSLVGRPGAPRPEAVAARAERWKLVWRRRV